MHDNFVDRRRRFLNLRNAQVGNILPEHFASFYPKFINLLKKYYDFEDQNKSTELLSHIFATRDINETDITLLSYIEDELLLGESYFKGFGQNETELRAAANFSNTLFRSKGSKFAIEWFFRSFYNLDAQVIYTKENVFKIGDAQSRIGADSLKYLTDDKLYQTFALLVRASIPISQWKEIFKLFVHPAGMYLGGEVFLVDEAFIPTSSSEQIIQTTSTVYNMVVDATSKNEGETYTFNITGTNVPNSGTDALYWYGEHVGANSAEDFANSSLPLINDKQYVPINSSAGQFTVSTIIDADVSPAEGLEQFKIYLEDKAQRPITNLTLDIVDLLPSYTITTNASQNSTGSNPFNDQSLEGENVTFTLTGTNVPNGGNTTLYWYVEPGAGTPAAQADFITTWPTVVNPEPISITGSTGSFTVQSKVDGGISDPAESVEEYVIKIVNAPAGGVLKLNESFYLVDRPAVLTVSVNTVTEGDQIAATVVITDGDQFAEGHNLTWSIGGALATESRIPTKNGTAVYAHNGGAGTIINVPTIENSSFQNTISGTFTVIDIDVANPSAAGSTSFDLIDADPVYILSSDGIGAGQGDTVSFSVSGTNISDGTIYFYVDFAGNTQNSDFSTPPPQSSTRLAVNMVSGVNTTPIQLTYAALIDEDNPYQANLDATGPGGATVQNLASLDQVILSNANTTSIALSAGSSATPNEFSTISFEITGVVPDASNYKYWFAGSGITSSDFGAIAPNGFGSVSSKKDVAIVSGAAIITVPLAADQNREGNETFNLILGGTGTNNPPIGQSPTITIQDTSLPTVSVKNYTSILSNQEALTVTEDNNLYIGVSSVGNQNPNISYTVTLSGAGSGIYSGVTSITISNPTMGGTDYVTFVTDGDNAITQGPRTINVTVTENQGSTTIASTTLTLNDQDSSYALNLTSSATPNEGDTLTFDIVTTNVSITTELFVRPTDFVGKTVELQSGSNIIAVTGGTSGLSVGMQALQVFGGITISGSITSVGSTSITMSQTQSVTTPPSDTLFGTTSDWLYFFNSPNYVSSYSTTMNTGTKTINTITSENESDTANKTYTFGLYESVASNTALATETVTLTNVTSGPSIDFVFNENLDKGVSNYPAQVNIISTILGFSGPGNPPSEIEVAIKVKDDGILEVRTVNDGGLFNNWPLASYTVGYWNGAASGGPVPNVGNGYSITATQTPAQSALSENIGFFIGNFGTTVSLASNQEWKIDFNYSGSGERIGTAFFDLTVTENSSGLSVTKTIFLTALINNEGIGNIGL